ncbi:tRNA methyltransferase [Candidatus Magnetomorum sp. HK-1]|nr:tRNA methyltransferase [Candidatus Magnetomorum sp. HK-1]
MQRIWWICRRKMKKDNIFALKNDPVPAFEFNEEVTSVFDDMIKRSVPLYMESLKRQCQLTLQSYQKGTIIYDLGCSHGNLGIMIHEGFEDRPYKMVAVDSSPSMIEKYKNRLEQHA